MNKKIETIYKNDGLYNILDDLKKGNYLIPGFQREYVWSIDKVIQFLNALLNREPFGYITLWDTNNKEVINIDAGIFNIYLNEKELNKIKSYNQNIFYIIDGQQRLTTISLLYKFEEILKYSWIDDYPNIKKIINELVFDYEESKFVSKKFINHKNFILPNEIFIDDLEEWKEKYDNKYNLNDINNLFIKISKIRSILKNTNIGIIELKNYDLDKTIEIFNNMNTKGQKLSIFEIINAKWQKIDINLKNEIKDLYEFLEKKFDLIDFDNKNKQNEKYTLFIDCLYLIISNTPILSGTDKIKFSIDNKEALEKTLQIFKETFKRTIQVLSNLNFNWKTIPSWNIIKWLSYFIYKNNNEYPKQDELNFIRKYIVYSCLNDRYSSSTNEKLKKDLEIFATKNNFNENSLNDFKIKKFTNEIINDISYSNSSKSMKFKIIMHYYLSNFSDICFGETKISPNYINYHHIFPKSAKSKKSPKQTYQKMWPNIINNIANIIPIHENSNKKISNKNAPEFINWIENELYLNNNFDYDKYCLNKQLLIDEDFELFLEDRTKKLTSKINAFYKL